MRDILTELRPKTFSDFAGNEEIVGTLRRLIAKDRVPSAILFSGAPGSGKTSLATIVGRALSCENWKQGIGDPCGRCKSCSWSSVGAYPWNGYHLPPGYKPSEKAFADGLDSVANGVVLWSVSNRAIMTVDDLDGLAKPLQIILRGRLDNPWPAGNLLATSAEPEKLDPPLRQRMIEYHLHTPELGQISSWCMRMLKDRLDLKVKDKGAVDALVKYGNMNFRSILKIVHALATDGGVVSMKSVKMAAMECGYGL